MILLPFDTETTGIPSSKRALTDPAQPHLVSLSALQVDPESGRIMQSMSKLVEPDGWEWPDDHPAKVNAHGLEASFCAEHGRPEKQVLDEFLDLWAGTAHLIAHNLKFDTDIIKIAIARHYPGDSALLTAWESAVGSCTMQTERAHLRAAGVKAPANLAATYERHMGEPLESHHSANADAVACWQIWLSQQAVR
jgi:DNA polymerase-3 subunit epsilon